MKKHYIHIALTIILAVALVIETFVLIDVNEERKYGSSGIDSICYSEFASFCSGCWVNWEAMDEAARVRQREENDRHLYTAYRLCSGSSYAENENFVLLVGYLYQLSEKGTLYDVMDGDMAERLNAFYPHLGKEDGSALAGDIYDRLSALAALREE